MDKQKDLIMRLSDAFGPSGMEDEVVAIAKAELSEYDLKEDRMRNLYIESKVKQNGVNMVRRKIISHSLNSDKSDKGDLIQKSDQFNNGGGHGKYRHTAEEFIFAVACFGEQRSSPHRLKNPFNVLFPSAFIFSISIVLYSPSRYRTRPSTIVITTSDAIAL